MELNQVTVSVADVERAVRFYRTLGLVPVVLSPHYARFVCPDGRSTFSVHANAQAIAGTTVVYFECDDLDDMVATLEAVGVRFDAPPIDQPWLWREAHLADPDGNRLCLYRAGAHRLDPPWRITDPSTSTLLA